MKRPIWWLLAAIAGFVTIAIGVRTCSPSPSWLGEGSESTEEITPGLTLRDVTLEQQDESGQLLWKVDADEVTYSGNQEKANLVNPEGELYQDGELLYRVKADKGIIEENGQVIFLEDNIVATGIQNRMVINGQNLEWRPEESLMIVRNGLTGRHPQVNAQANEARVYDAENRMELLGDVVATTVVDDPEVDPWLKLQGETLQWRWQQQTLDTLQPIRIERFENQQITQALVGQKALVELAEERATIEGDVQAQLLDSKTEMTTPKAIWEVDEQLIQAQQSVRVLDAEQEITVTAQQGQFDLAEQLALFSRDVLAIAAKNDGRLTTNRLRWNLKDDTVLAEGNVNYQQADPRLTITGPRARGRIESQTVIVDGGNVVTEIVPNVN
ncbi:MAG: LPS export ABC transporter periplasmic protein LptC [Leptolyngbyaceae cyanobacterium]